VHASAPPPHPTPPPTQQAAYTKTWGNGFVTDPAIIKAAQISDPNFFFSSLVAKPYANAVIVSPSMYPPSLLSVSVPPNEYWKRMAKAVGYLKTTGYCGKDGCVKFPIVVRGRGRCRCCCCCSLFPHPSCIPVRPQAPCSKARLSNDLA
jgi:hypothetical protein